MELIETFIVTDEELIAISHYYQKPVTEENVRHLIRQWVRQEIFRAVDAARNAPGLSSNNSGT